MTPYEGLARFPDRSRPLLTHYDGPLSRVELSVATTANAVAKAAGLLRDEVGLGPGTTFSVDLPCHWQLPVWVWAGLTVGATCARFRADHVDARIVGPAQLAAPSGGGSGVGPADELLASACDAFGMPLAGGVPAGVIDVAVEVRAHPDVHVPDPVAASSGRLVLGEVPVSWADALDRASAHPAARPGARLWVDDAGSADCLLLSCVLPLAVHGSVVLATGLTADQAERLRGVEGATGP